MVRTYCGHGIGELFHTVPNVPHYAKNKAKGVMQVEGKDYVLSDGDVVFFRTSA